MCARQETGRVVASSDPDGLTPWRQDLNVTLWQRRVRIRAVNAKCAQALPAAARFLRDSESTMTASTSTTPVIMKLTDESRFRRVRPDEIDWITTMPSSAANAVPAAAEQARAADDGCRDGVEVGVAGAGALIRRREPCRREDAADGGERRAQHEDRDVDPVHADAGTSGGLDRPADGVHRAAPARAGQREVHDDDEREEEQEHHADAARQVEIPGGDQQEREQRAAAHADLEVALAHEVRGGALPCAPRAAIHAYAADRQRDHDVRRPRRAGTICWANSTIHESNGRLIDPVSPSTQS